MKRENTRNVAAKVALIIFALVCGAAPAGVAQKLKYKHKEKRFEPVVKERLADYAGRYVGIAPDYYLEITLDVDGELAITSREGARRATLRDIRIAGARLTATRVYADGTTKAFEATFANRILNGETAFGVILENLELHYQGITFNRLFYRLDPAR